MIAVGLLLQLFLFLQPSESTAAHQARECGISGVEIFLSIPLSISGIVSLRVGQLVTSLMTSVW